MPSRPLYTLKLPPSDAPCWHTDSERALEVFIGQRDSDHNKCQGLSRVSCSDTTGKMRILSHAVLHIFFSFQAADVYSELRAFENSLVQGKKQTKPRLLTTGSMTALGSFRIGDCARRDYPRRPPNVNNTICPISRGHTHNGKNSR